MLKANGAFSSPNTGNVSAKKNFMVIKLTRKYLLLIIFGKFAITKNGVPRLEKYKFFFILAYATSVSLIGSTFNVDMQEKSEYSVR